MVQDADYDGELCFWKAANPPLSNEDTPISSEDDWIRVYEALTDELEDSRLFDASLGDACTFDNSMGFSLSESRDYWPLCPRTALGQIRDGAELLGRWGIYLDGNLFAYNHGGRYMFRIVVTKDYARLFRYDHDASLRTSTSPVVKLTLLREHLFTGYVNATGTLPKTKKEKEEDEKERKRKRKEEIERDEGADHKAPRTRDLIKGDEGSRS